MITSQIGRLRSFLPGLRKRVPVHLQMADLDCGAACLSMVMSYHGSRISLSQARATCEQAGVAQSTTTLIKVARGWGMRAHLMALDLPDPDDLPLPAILHWDFSHFVVLEAVKPAGYEIVDPAMGRRIVSHEEFDKSFTGIAIAIVPSPDYTPIILEANPAFRRFLGSTVNQPIFRKLAASILIFSLGIQALSMCLPYLSMYMVDVMLATRATMLSPWVLGLIAIFMVNIALVNWLRSQALTHMQRLSDQALMEGYFERILRLPVSFFLERSAGDIISRANSSTVIREALSHAVLSSTMDSVLIVANLAWLMWLSPSFALITMGLCAIQIAFFVSYARALRDPVQTEAKNQSRYQSYLTEVIAGIVTVKANAAEEPVRQRWRLSLGHHLAGVHARSGVDAWYGAVGAALRLGVPAILLWYSVVQYLEQPTSIGELLLLNFIAAMALGPVAGMVPLARNFQYFLTHGARLGELWEQSSEQENADKPDLSSVGDITVRDLHFRYKTAKEACLHGCTLEIPLGSRCAIVGPSGSGKSTLVSLILGFHLPSEGDVYWAGRPLREVNLRCLRGRVGYVAQNNFLFNGSIRSNIALARPTATMDDIEEAARVAGLLKDIQAMPMGMDTIVGEGGCNLSGGQRQRVAIARAVLTKPEILVLDEATSHLDAATESEVVEALAQVATTQIWITHRINSLRHCDRVYVIDGGRIVDQGDLDELAERNDFVGGWLRSELSLKL